MSLTWRVTPIYFVGLYITVHIVYSVYSIATFVGDFGISRILVGTSDMATTFTGTPYYMSPEVLKHDGYNSKSDVWWVVCNMFLFMHSMSNYNPGP